MVTIIDRWLGLAVVTILDRWLSLTVTSIDRFHCTLKSVNECMCGDLQVQGVVADR